MIIYPALDLKSGQVVRLKEGVDANTTVFSTDPVRVAQDFAGRGAKWLHVVNLDGAFARANDNLHVLEVIAAVGLPVQFGGGLRSLDDVTTALECGAARVVLGTVAVRNPELVREAVNAFGADRVCIGLDSRDGKVTTHGWTEQSETTPAELGRAVAAVGVRHALFTDVSRDGMLTGVNVDATVALARDTGLNVIASGGVSSLDDIRRLAGSGMVAGAIIGMALYTGAIRLEDAIREGSA
ncbi:MAG: 1-(5-phosphoribosyl)-5-[(5-phosphoribosylamino)methylideneamino]imidazole-4-carboxamide isomerase [Chloroflexi bacterium]|nr:1-(5-phosphoribosyl)-5-[(5-phosphoribosylamino)methylideneamino]imidazole-4-carboxamide isomerase [Chloroflexota bacterium]